MDSLSEYMNAVFQLPTMRPVAEVLALVASTDFYRQAIEVGEGMCWALRVAEKKGLITSEERVTASYAVEEYLHLFPCTGAYLWQRLFWAKMPHAPDDLIKLYSDWDNRPKPR